MDAAQIILVVAVCVLTAILALVGFEVFLIFRELRKTVRKVNQIADDASSVSGAISHQITNLSEFVSSLKNTVDLAKIFFDRERKPEKSAPRSEKKETDDGILLEDAARSVAANVGSTVRRFFTRAGKRLS